MTDTRTPYDDIKYHARAGVKAITQLPQEVWANWIVYMLEVLDAVANPYTTITKDEILRRVRDSISCRLHEGHW